jgi:hypothetical protein
MVVAEFTKSPTIFWKNIYCFDKMHTKLFTIDLCCSFYKLALLGKFR